MRKKDFEANKINFIINLIFGEEKMFGPFIVNGLSSSKEILLSL